MNKIELQIATKGMRVNLFPIVLDGIEWQTERAGTPSRLTFTVVKDQTLADAGGFVEGDDVILRVNDRDIFKGFIFEKTRDRNQHIQVTAYDQLRYFTNKHIYQYENKRADEVLKAVCSAFNLTTGNIENTGFKIQARNEDNQTLFDIVLNALDLTYNSTGKDYVLYDEFGRICLRYKFSEDMVVRTVLLNSANSEDFDYKTSIDNDTYNRIIVTQETEAENVGNVFQVQDYASQGKWGVLSFILNVGKNENAVTVANNVLKLKNRKTRELSIKGIIGDLDVRAGKIVPFLIDLGDINERIFLQCDSVTHHFYADRHTMDVSFSDFSDWEKTQLKEQKVVEKWLT